MKILPVLNQKGGCGKTTTVMNLAHGFTKIGYRILVVDADPQRSSATWSMVRGNEMLPFEVFTARQVRYDFDQVLATPDYDLVLVDSPPGIADADSGVVFRFMLRVLAAADLILVPLMPSSLDFSAARTLVRYLEKEKPKDTRVAVLLNAMERTNLSSDAKTLAPDLFAPVAGIVLKSTIGRRVVIAEVCGLGQTVFNLRASLPAAQEYTSLAKELLQCLAQPLSSPMTFPTSSTSSTSPSVQAEPVSTHPAQDRLLDPSYPSAHAEPLATR